MQITLFYITNSNKEAAEQLGNLAIEKKLAACANIFPINSIFPWDGSIQHSGEYVLLLKTILSRKTELLSFIEENHPYELPCILNWEVEVNDEYGKWIEKNLIQV